MIRSALLAAILCVAACAAPLSVERRGDLSAYREQNHNYLGNGETSFAARLALQASGLEELYDSDPDEALSRLEVLAEKTDTRDALYALAELSLERGIEKHDADRCLNASVYAYLFLVGAADRPPVGAFDPRARWACDIYAIGLARGFAAGDHDDFVPAAGTRKLPGGELRVRRVGDEFAVGGVKFERFEPAGEFVVRGVRGRVRLSGFGAPLLASGEVAPEEKAGSSSSEYFPPKMRAAATALLRVDGEFADFRAKGLDATIEIVSPYGGAKDVEIRGRRVPLEIDLTTALAASLGDDSFLSFENAGFMGGKTSFQNGLLMLAPYQPGKVPVVLVHGTGSSPTRWAELLNELYRDPEIRKGCQFWLFIYSSGGPILAPAADLRDALATAAERFDPKGTDPALRDMVVMGHSQGGLLTRLLVTSSGDRFWKNVTPDKKFDDVVTDTETRKTLERVIFFEPLPNVTSVVFMATPHNGSFLASGVIGWLGKKFASIPGKMIDTGKSLTSSGMSKILGRDEPFELPTSVDNMDPGSPFLTALNELPIAPDVDVHSIIGQKSDGVLAESDDGVVAYVSSHIERGTEAVVRNDHSLQGNPATVAEVRRILREHLAKRAAPAPVPAPAGAGK
jgi:hypothetical protein